MSIRQAFLESRFEITFRRANGEAFQAFFATLMGFAYPADFMPSRPWGNRGDRKNDGYLKSQRRLFQLYAPNELTERLAVSKISEDFEGAKPYWGRHFDHWTFVHNADAGLPPHVHKLLLDLQQANPGITIETWSLHELLPIFRSLSVEDQQFWLGVAPSEETAARLGFHDLEVVLDTIASKPTPPPSPVREVPMGKIEANALPESTVELLKAGMTKAPLVQDFFDQWHDATLGERIAEAFRQQYIALRNQGPHSRIFTELQKWAGGDAYGTTEHQVAVLTVIAYYFERCDIYEEPRGGQ